MLAGAGAGGGGAGDGGLTSMAKPSLGWIPTREDHFDASELAAGRMTDSAATDLAVVPLSVGAGTTAAGAADASEAGATGGGETATGDGAGGVGGGGVGDGVSDGAADASVGGGGFSIFAEGVHPARAHASPAMARRRTRLVKGDGVRGVSIVDPQSGSRHRTPLSGKAQP